MDVFSNWNVHRRLCKLYCICVCLHMSVRACRCRFCQHVSKLSFSLQTVWFIVKYIFFCGRLRGFESRGDIGSGGEAVLQNYINTYINILLYYI